MHLLIFILCFVAGTSIKFYSKVGSISAADLSRLDCYKAKPSFRCLHADACSKYIRGLDRLCLRMNQRSAALQRAQKAVQYDEPEDKGALSVTNPHFLTPLSNVTVEAGDTLVLKCSASGKPQPRILIQPKRSYRRLIYRKRSRTSSRRGFRDVRTQYKIYNVSKQHQGWYRCTTVNDKGQYHSDSFVTVQSDACNSVTCAAYEKCVSTQGKAECVCMSSEDCADEPVKPVCGSDCISYFNLCMMKVKACRSGYNVSVWIDNGVCPAIEYPTVNLINNNKLRVQAGASLRLKCGAKGNPPPNVAWYKQTKTGINFVTDSDLLEVQDLKRRDNGRYLCKATNCINKVVRSRSVNVDVIDMSKMSRKACHVFGDPHVISFDGSMYSFVGDCDYVIAMDCSHDPIWFVYGRIRTCGKKSSCLKSITVIHKRTSVQLLRGWIINHDGSKVIVAPGGKVDIEQLSIKFDRDGLVYSVTVADTGVAVTWDGYNSATVIAANPLNSCGLCGSFDNVVENDIEKSWFSGFYNNVEIQQDTDETSQDIASWKLDSFSMKKINDTTPNKPCPTTVAHKGGPVLDTCEGETEKMVVTEQCRDVIDDTAFAHCLNGDKRRDFLLRACIRDTCGHDSEWAFCEFVQAVSRHCEEETQIPVLLQLDHCPNKSTRKINMMKLFL